MMTDHQADDLEQKRFRLQWGALDSVDTIYATHFYIMHTGREFFLLLGEVDPPIFDGTNPAELTDVITVIPRVKVALSVEAMGDLVGVLNTNFSKFLSARATLTNESSETEE
jgi:hypothetical protein